MWDTLNSQYSLGNKETEYLSSPEKKLEKKDEQIIDVSNNNTKEI